MNHYLDHCEILLLHGKVNMNRLRLDIFLESLQTAFTSVPALLPASPRSDLARPMATVDGQSSDLKLGCYA